MKIINVLNKEKPANKFVVAELENRTLSAECPKCHQLDGYVSTGQHTSTGFDIVRCSGCGTEFNIKW